MITQALTVNRILSSLNLNLNGRCPKTRQATAMPKQRFKGLVHLQSAATPPHASLMEVIKDLTKLADSLVMLPQTGVQYAS